jgi:hypothetical protein
VVAVVAGLDNAAQFGVKIQQRGFGQDGGSVIHVVVVLPGEWPRLNIVADERLGRGLQDVLQSAERLRKLVPMGESGVPPLRSARQFEFLPQGLVGAQHEDLGLGLPRTVETGGDAAANRAGLRKRGELKSGRPGGVDAQCFGVVKLLILGHAKEGEFRSWILHQPAAQVP